KANGKGAIVAGIALAVVCMAGFYSVIAGFVSGVFAARIRRQSGKAAKRQSGKAAKRQSGKAAKRQSGKATKRQSGNAACHAMTKRRSSAPAGPGNE
ncbi:hypothetical protein, partial [Burkholderia pseudomallei]|uniref:hypothetical protein n=1 Tax=Burkholderia pseudomallei TaxID=28450 RepID=UPI00187C9201